MNVEDIEYLAQANCLWLGAIGRCMEVHSGTIDRYAIIRAARGLLEVLEPGLLRGTAPDRDQSASSHLEAHT